MRENFQSGVRLSEGFVNRRQEPMYYDPENGWTKGIYKRCTREK